jgi:predicted Fe-Mo cluster-binding NifX family protein
MKKIAIPVKDGIVDGHFGHCEYLNLYTVNDNNEIIEQEMLFTPEACGCKSGLVPILAEKNVNVMLAGGIGSGAVDALNKSNIDVFSGFTGSVNEVLDAFVNKGARGTDERCAAHESGCH